MKLGVKSLWIKADLDYAKIRHMEIWGTIDSRPSVNKAGIYY